MEHEVRLVAVRAGEREVFLRMAELHFRGLNPAFVPHEDWKRSYFETIMANPQFFLRWIVLGDDCCGFLLYGLEPHRFLPRKTGTIYELYVDPTHRRQGIARRAARIAIRELQLHGPSKIQLEVVEGNHGAAALWKSLGFEKVTERYVLKAAL
jgi:ribosomal protein S18 acetylase RimI-like enzyme